MYILPRWKLRHGEYMLERVGLTRFGGTPRDSRTLPEQPCRTAVALIQWFPSACDREPFLAEPLSAPEAEEQFERPAQAPTEPGGALLCATLPVWGWVR